LIDKSSPDEIMFFWFTHFTDFTLVYGFIWTFFWTFAHAAGALIAQAPE
jgi:hypothetical protein